MSTNTLLYEITQGEWLMDVQHLHQLREALKLGFTERKIAAKKASKKRTELLHFVNEDYQRISPSSIQDIPEGSIAVINAVGIMMKYGSWFALGADEVIRQLDFCNNLQNISAIVLVVDGPGGAVSAIPPFIEFNLRKKKPIVALCDSSLSLHYWMPNAIADHVMASNTISSRFGSVGVVTNWLDVREYWENLGIKEVEVYPEESKHKNEIWRKMKENEKEGKQMLVDMHLRPLAQKFQEAVKTARPNLKPENEGVLSGRTFTAEKALSFGMIDSIGTMQDAFDKARMLAEVSNY